jgi:hypothetical protein
MANALYDKGREGFLDGSIDWDTNDIRIILIDEADTTINLATNEDLADREAASRVAITTGGMGSKTVTAGVADAANETWTAVSGDISESIDIYQHTGTESTSRLICNIDSATGLPVTPNGGDITVAWDDGANKIFKL